MKNCLRLFFDPAAGGEKLKSLVLGLALRSLGEGGLRPRTIFFERSPAKRDAVRSLSILLLITQLLNFLITPVLALNDTTKVWNFTLATTGDYTKSQIDAVDVVTVDDTGAHPITNVNRITNPAFATNNTGWSTAANPPSGWVEVPVDANYNPPTGNFLAMKYEAKCAATSAPTVGLTTPADTTYKVYRDDGTVTPANNCTDGGSPDNNRVVTSLASGYPIAYINQTESATRCSTVTLGTTSAHLITNNEWMTLARNSEAQGANWYNGVVGTNFMFMGHNDNGPATALVASTDNDPYSGTNDSASSCDGVYSNFVVGDDTTAGRACVGQKRTFTLSNSSVIWDLSGNIWEWTNNTIPANQQPTAWDGATEYTTGDWSDFTSGSLTRRLGKIGGASGYLGGSPLQEINVEPSGNYNSNQGVGRIWHYSKSSSSTSYGFLRGGNWLHGANAGAFTLALNNTPDTRYYGIGFRCASDPVAILQSFSSSSGRGSTGGNTISIGNVTDGKLYQSLNLGNTSTYDFSTYVYDSTGAGGGVVSESIAQLWYNDSVITTGYTAVVGETDWYKLTGTLTGADASREFGLLVKAGKTVKADDFTLSKSGTYSLYTTTAYTNANLISWDSFATSQTAAGNASLSFQLCPDEGSLCGYVSSPRWQYYTAGAWTNSTSASSAYANTVSELTQTAMQAFSTTSKKLSVKVIMGFGGADVPDLDSITLGLTTDISAPSISLTPLTPDPNSDNTPAVTGTATDITGTISNVKYQMDSILGSWTACTADDLAFDQASEAFTCTVSPALSDGAHTIYVQATDSNGNTTASGSESTNTFVIDVTSPPAFDLDSPRDKAYTNQERPSFKWKSVADPTSGLNKYTLEVDNGETADFTLNDIPPSRTTDYETSKYFCHYENFNDGDQNNNYISCYTKETVLSSASNNNEKWSEAENGGKLKEGRRTWRVKARDNAGNEREESRILFVDKTSPNLEDLKINDLAFDSSQPSSRSAGPSASNSNGTYASNEERSSRTSSSNSNSVYSSNPAAGGVRSFITNDQTPTFSGKIIDPLSTGDGSTATQDETGPKVASGPKTLEVKIEKKNFLGLYDLHTLSFVNLSKTYWTADSAEITDNSQNKSDKYSTFSFTQQTELPLGKYRISITGKDSADNSGGTTTLYLNITTFEAVVTPEEKEIIEEETKELTLEQKEKFEKELEITKLQEPGVFEKTGGNIVRAIARTFSRVFEETSRFARRVTDSTSNIVRALARTFTGNTVRAIARTIVNIFEETSHFVRRVTDGVGSGLAFIGSRIAMAIKTTRDGLLQISFALAEKAQDISGKGGIMMISFIYKFVPEPTLISEIKVAVLSPTSVKISWQTNHPASGKVNYGFSEGNYTFEEQSGRYSLNHEFILTNLNPDTQYHYEVMSQNKNYVYESNRQFKTP